MKLLKHILTPILAALMLVALALPVAADVIYEPRDSFYEQHREECTAQFARRYTANSEQGYVYLYRNPESSITVGALSNGEQISLSWAYTAPDGEVWGILTDDSGWVKMSELSLVYDSIAFLEEHKVDCLPYTEGSYTIEANESNRVLTWAYPGGELKAFSFTDPEFIGSVQMTYTDESGNVWGHIGYFRGTRDVWICLSAPYDTEVGGHAVKDHEVTLKAEPTPSDDLPVSDGNTTVLITVGVLVAAVVLATAAIIAVMFRKKKQV